MDKKEFIARRTALEFKQGDLVNLGAGLPGFVASYIDKSKNIFMHTENGIVGAGPDDPSMPRDLFRTDASENFVSILPGGAIVDSCTSFGLIRGGHLTATVLGTMQVDAEGSLANWMIPGKRFVGMGGAMDLVVGTPRVIVVTEHHDKDGRSKIMKKCTFPVTAFRVVRTIITELAYIEVKPEGLLIMEVAPGLTPEDVQRQTDAPLLIDPNWKTMQVW